MNSVTATSIPSLLRNLFHDYGVSYASSFLGFVITIMVARLLGAESFAWVSAGVAFGSFLIPLSTLGSEQAFVRDAVAAVDQRVVAHMAARTFGMRVTVMSILLGLLFLCAPFYAGSVGNGIAIALVSGWAGMQGLYPAAWFDYMQQTRTQNRLVLAERIGALMLISCIWLLPVSVHSAIAVGLALMASRLASVIVQVKTWAAISGTSDFSWQLIFPGKHLGIDIPVTAALVSNALFVYGPQLFLKKNRSEFAAYGLAFQIVGLIFVFQSQALRLVTVRIAQACKHRKQILRSTLRNAVLIGGGSAILSLIAFVVIQYLPGLMSDRGYHSATNVTIGLCIWIVVAGAGVSVAQHVIALNEQAFYFRTAMIAGPVGLVLGALFVPAYGAISAVAILLGIHSLAILANLGRLIAISAAQPERVRL